MRSTSYPAIALLVSVLILVVAFGLVIAGSNNYLEKKREVGKELLEEFTHYNILQYYLYVLSDYEVRKGFFNVLYRDFLSSLDSEGYLNIKNLNEEVLKNPPDGCTGFVKYVLTRDSIKGYPTLAIYPCLLHLPFEDFKDSFKEDFVNSIFKNFRLKDDLKSINDFYHTDITLLEKAYGIGENYFFLTQKVKYFFKSKHYERSLTLKVDYSEIPNIVLYNSILAYEYEDRYYRPYIDFLKKVFGEYENPIYTYGSVENFFKELGIEYSEKVGDYTLLFGKQKDAYLNDLQTLFDTYVLKSDNINRRQYLKVKLSYPLFCANFGKRALSYKRDAISYKDLYGCKIPTLTDKIPRKHEYFIEECLLPNSAYETEPDSKMDEEIARLYFYNFTFYKDPEIIETDKIEKFLGIKDKSIEEIKKEYGNYLWPTDGKFNDLVLVSIGELYPVRCRLGYDIHKEYFDILRECWDKYSELANSRNPYLEIWKACECSKLNEICYEECISAGRKDCIQECCMEWLLEWAYRIRSISRTSDMRPVQIAIYWPYQDLDTLKYLLSK